jgi:uncharacterized protein YutE (UPF0331/DUF86 family)
MPKEVIFKKLDQIKELLAELERLLNMPLEDFKKDSVVLRAAERNFQLIVDLASDINTQILIERGKETPDTYRQSFSDLEKERILGKKLAERLVRSAKLRNILVHEYDFEEDDEKFYASAKESLSAYHEYIRIIYEYAQRL